MLAYGFEDLTGAQWALVQALAGRTDVSVSLPYEPGRPAFASLGRTAADLGGLADGRVEELPPAYAEIAHPALAHLERTLFSEGERLDPPPLEGAVRFLEAAGSRGTLELVADEVLRLVRDGTAPEEIALVCPSLDRLRAPLETALSTAGVPFAFEGRVRLGQIPFGHALLSALRFLWQGEGRRDLFGFLRSPYSGLPRAHADYLEGRLRGNGVRTDIEERTVRLRGQPLPQLDDVRAAPSPTEAVRVLATGMLRAAHGLESPPASELRPGRPACPRAGPAPAAGARGLARPRGRDRPRGRARRARARAGSPGRRRRAGPGGGHRPPRGPARAASRPSSCSASRRAAFPGGRRPRRSSTTTRGATSTSGRARASSAPTPSRASGSSSTPRAPARPVA